MAFLSSVSLLAWIALAKCQDDPSCPAIEECVNQPLRCLDDSKLEVKECCTWVCASGSEVCYSWAPEPQEFCEDGSEPQRDSCDSFSCNGIPFDTGPAIAAGRVYMPAVELVVRSDVHDFKDFHGNGFWQTQPNTKSTTTGNLSARLFAACLSSMKPEEELLSIHGTAGLDIDFNMVVAECGPDADMGKWLTQARDEHASVAAFALLQLELLAHGAPHELINRVLMASQEELAHVTSCEALANSSVVLTLPPHEMKTQLRQNWKEVLQRSLYEGVVPEGNAALQLWREADAEIKAGRRQRGRLLWAMGRDEARHAELAHDIALWAAAAHGIDVPAVRVAADGVVIDHSDLNIKV